MCCACHAVSRSVSCWLAPRRQVAQWQVRAGKGSTRVTATNRRPCSSQAPVAKNHSCHNRSSQLSWTWRERRLLHVQIGKLRICRILHHGLIKRKNKIRGESSYHHRGTHTHAARVWHCVLLCRVVRFVVKALARFLVQGSRYVCVLARVGVLLWCSRRLDASACQLSKARPSRLLLSAALPELGVAELGDRESYVHCSFVTTRYALVG